jgi:tetratricopeptide (TPR) repeat protein
VGRTAFVPAFGLAVVVLAAAGPGRASLVSPDDPMAVPVRPDGLGEPFPFDEFRRRYAALTNMLDARNNPADRQRVLKRIEERSRARNLPPDEAVALAADLLRVGQVDEAVNRLKPLYDDRDRRGTRTYPITAALVHAHAARGEWAHALNYLPDLFDLDPPPARGLTPAQRAWQTRLDREYLPHYLQLRRAEAEASPRPDPEDEDPTPLFPLPARDRPADPVRFVNDAGVYEPGALAAAERAKLPPDALAVVQQLLLWFPSDTRLLWLLAELYAADGQLAEAQTILDEAAWSRQYGNRKKLMDHRAAVAAAVEAARPKPAELPISLRTVLIYFGAVAAAAVVAAVRAASRRRGGCPPAG